MAKPWKLCVNGKMVMNKEINPYYAAWERHTGGGANWEFINWMNRRWLEIEAEYKKPRRTIKSDEFLQWLENRKV